MHPRNRKRGRRSRLALLLIACLASSACGFVDRVAVSVEAHDPYDVSAEARSLHSTLVIGDLHSDSLLWQRDLRERTSYGHQDLPRLREGNFAVQVMGVVTQVPLNQSYEQSSNLGDMITLLALMHRWPRATWSSNYARAIYQAEEMQGLVDDATQQLRLLRTRGDVQALLAQRASGSKAMGMLLALEGAHATDGELENLQRLWDAGFRMLGLVHFFDNAIGGSLHGAEAGGLTELGREMVRRADEQGWIIDVAHSSRQVVEDTLALVKRPVVVSHTGMRGHCNSERNLEDERLKAITEAGGLVGIGFWAGAVCNATPEGVADALRYAVDALGVEHVALGSDWDGGTTVTFDVSETVALTDALLARGFDETEIRAVMGGNLALFLERELPD